MTPRHALASSCVFFPADGDSFSSGMSGGDTSELRCSARLRSYEKHTVIVGNVDIANTLGCVRSGLLKVVLVTEDGRETIIRFLAPSDIIGDYLITWPNMHVEAVTDCQVCWQDRETVATIAQGNPNVAARILLQLEQQIERSNERMVLLSFRGTLERLVAYMCRIAEPEIAMIAVRDGAVGPRTALVRFQISRKDIAAYLDMSVETISRHLHALADASVLRILGNATFEIHDANKLFALAFRDSQ